MKWIGQHIYDQISRFRDDVYLEGISTSTETDMLVVDSNNKVSKRAIDAITVDVSDFMGNGADNRVLTATGTDAMQGEEKLTFSTEETIATLKLFGNDTADYCTIVSTTTVDDDFALANMTLTADGTFNVNSVSLATITSAGVEIANGSATGATALLIDNDDADQIALDIEAANDEAAIVRVKAPDLTTANAVFINCDSLTTGKALKLDVDDALTASAANHY